MERARGLGIPWCARAKSGLFVSFWPRLLGIRNFCLLLGPGDSECVPGPVRAKGRAFISFVVVVAAAAAMTILLLLLSYQ